MEADASADTFKSIKRRVREALLRALEQAAFAIYYPEADVTLQIRKGKCIRVDVREIEQVN